MKSTRIKVSVSQDGLLPQESVDVATIDFPFIPKKLLRALGFERVDNSTFVGVMPVFVNLDEKDQEIEIELGVSMPEMRKKVLEMFQPVVSENTQEEPEPEQKPKKTAKRTNKTTGSTSTGKKKTKSASKKSTTKSSTSKSSGSTKSKKSTSGKKPATKKSTSKRTTSKNTKG